MSIFSSNELASIENELRATLTEDEKQEFYYRNYTNIKIALTDNVVNIYIPCTTRSAGESWLLDFKDGNYYVFSNNVIYSPSSTPINPSNMTPGVYSDGAVFQYSTYDTNVHMLIISAPVNNNSVFALVGEQNDSRLLLLGN